MLRAPLGFGYTRQDALLVCVAVPAAGFAMYGALSAAGVGAIQAGNAVLLTLVGGLTLVWTGTYVARVMRKDMTYVKQLDAYEAAVMAKRLEELPPGELERLMEEVESDKAKIAARNAARGGENPLLKRD